MGKKKNRRMWSGIKPDDENFTPIPAGIGLNEERRKWEALSFWQRAERSEYFKREGKERWLRACVLLNSEEDFRIAYEIGPPDIYTDEPLGTLGLDARECRATLDSLNKLHPEISFPEPLKNLPSEPLEPLYGQVMLKDLSFDQLPLYVQPGAYFYPESATDEINEMVQQFKLERKERRRIWSDSTPSDENGAKTSTETSTSETKPPTVATEPTKQKLAKKQAGEKSEDQSDKAPTEGVVDCPPSGFGGILRHKEAAKPKKTVRWSNLMMRSDGNEIQLVPGNYHVVEDENVRMAIDAPLDDDGWDDF